MADNEDEKMGGILSRNKRKDCSKAGKYTYTVLVQTGDRPKAGTDANVYIVLHGDSGKSGETLLDVWFHDDFERGQLDKYTIKNQTFSTIDHVEVWRDNAGWNSEWYIETLMVVNEETKISTVFPVFRWIRANYHYNFIPLDTSLPQDDDRTEQRKKELVEKRELYQLQAKAPGLPPQVKTLPNDEKFSFDYIWDLSKRKATLILTSKLVLLTSGHWSSLTDLKNVYTSSVFTPPTDLNRWTDDVAFGRQRIAGMNNTLIHLCTEIPSKMAATADMLEPFLEGLKLPVALSDRRVFIVDHHVLKDCPTVEGFITCAPIGIFFQRGDGNIVPIAIQLFQDKSDDNPVFVPSDPEYTWIMAKLWFNNADVSIHQSITHLGYTHLMMEGIDIVTNRNLSQSHPLFKLLAPHFLYLIAINSRALEKLVSPGGWIDQTMTVGVVGLFELVRRQKKTWRMDVEGILPEELKKRGVADTDILPEYHFREDALALFDAIHKYTTNYVKAYYETDDRLLADEELQKWRQEMVASEEDNGLSLNGVPGEDGKFTTREQVALVLTCIIYTCSVGHAAANFKQYDEYAFPPNCPARLRGNPPKDKTALSEKAVLESLPDKPTTLNTMIVTKILSERGTKPLGDFEVNYIFDPKALAVVKEFREDLKQISDKIKSANEKREVPYPYLDPAEIPNAISI